MTGERETVTDGEKNEAHSQDPTGKGGMMPILEDEEEHEEEEEKLELSESALELKTELEQMNIAAPVMREEPETFDSSDFPESYQMNSNKEKVVLAFVENFRRQYIHLYRDRKPLFLTPLNEFNVEKFVCTTIRPIELPYKELYNWDGASDFVADYLNYKPLDPAYELPVRMYSPTTVLALQKGHCFEFSTLLVSILIGAGYDAYVVSGYASREVCLMDETREICPLLIPKEEPPPSTTNVESKKYAVKPPKDLTSKFERVQEEKRLKLIADEEAVRQAEEAERIRISELPPADPLHGLRVHSWVLVLSGKREIAETFFIEPLNGQARPLDYPHYHGIESVWNHKNYYACMQDCAEGVKKLKFDLGDCSMWEFIFLSNDKQKLKVEGEDPDEEDEEKEEEIEKYMDLPPSWIAPICLTVKDFTKRCPYGKKIIMYKRAKLEKFSPYLMKDGLVCRLSVFEDLDRTNLLRVKEIYQHRADKLAERLYNYYTGWITEYFNPGRAKKLKEHHYLAIGMIPENQRTMTFYHVARFDGLEKRVETATEMTEYFVDRDDFLYYRYAEYGVRQKKFGPAENTPRPVEKMIERYHRNLEKPANEDVAEVYYNVGEDKIVLTYHREDSRISASTREFLKPSADDEKGSVIYWNQDTSYSTYQADHARKDKKRVELYQMMLELIKSEEKSEERLRDSEREVQDLLDERIKEEAANELEISIYDTQRNDKAKKRRAMLEEMALEAQLASQEKELDYFAPFLSQMGNPEKLTRQQALKLREDCLADLKQRIIDKANLIQARFEKDTHELQKKQAWFQQNQVSMQKEDEHEYISYCSEAMFRIHILELRLARHKEMAPLKYMALERKIRADPRIAEFL